MIHSINDAIEAILLTIHNENFDVIEDNATNNANFSPYMRELQTFVTRINNDFLSKFNCKKLVAESCLPIANCSIDRFVLQASLIRPVSNPAGSKKLIQGELVKIFILSQK